MLSFFQRERERERAILCGWKGLIFGYMFGIEGDGERIGEGWLEYTHRLFFNVGLP